MQNVYIHSYFTFVDFGSLRKHILTNIDDFVILTPLGDIFYESGIFFTYLATGDKLVTIADLGRISKGLYSLILHFGGFWGIEEAYFEKY